MLCHLLAQLSHALRFVVAKQSKAISVLEQLSISVLGTWSSSKDSKGPFERTLRTGLTSKHPGVTLVLRAEFLKPVFVVEMKLTFIASTHTSRKKKTSKKTLGPECLKFIFEVWL